jgi:hypothetical protein
MKRFKFVDIPFSDETAVTLLERFDLKNYVGGCVIEKYKDCPLCNEFDKCLGCPFQCHEDGSGNCGNYVFRVILELTSTFFIHYSLRRPGYDGETGREQIQKIHEWLKENIIDA